VVVGARGWSIDEAILMSVKLTAEAFGTLLALSDLGRLRTVEELVAKDLMARGLAELEGDALLITPAGRRFAETCAVGQALGFSSPEGAYPKDHGSS
jgi:hypothetical protein